MTYSDAGKNRQIPITISAGLAIYPEHADSPTALLSAVAHKFSGGPVGLSTLAVASAGTS